jgi:GntR family transcriptional repressor for pyruvate dehydrogenase complex
VISRFKDLIQQGLLAPGSRLPSERELASALGVSRPTLRQALKALQVLGIVRSRQGDGSYLAEMTGDVMRAPLDFAIALKGPAKRDLFETRQTLEVKLAALAAERRTDQDLAKLRAALDAMRQSAGIADQWCENDIRFHSCIVEAAKNAVMASIYEMLSNLLVQSRKDSVRLLTDYEASFHSHVRVYEAIERRDSPGASEAMVNHFRAMESRTTQIGLAPETREPGSENASAPVAAVPTR